MLNNGNRRMKNCYLKPSMRVHKCEPCVELCSHSGNHDNGNHNGWNNPNNPHYPGNGNSEESEGED